MHLDAPVFPVADHPAEEHDALLAALPLSLTAIDARLGLPVPHALVVVPGHAVHTCDADGRVEFAVGGAEIVVLRSGFEPLRLTIAARSPQSNGTIPRVTAPLLPADGTLPVYFHARSPRRSHDAPVTSVSLFGEFCDWKHGRHPMVPRHDAPAVWEGRIAIPHWLRSSDVMFWVNGTHREDDPDHPRGGRNVRVALALETRHAGRPELAFVHPSAGAVVSPSPLRCELAWSGADGAGPDPASLTVDVNGAESTPPATLSRDGRLLTFDLPLAHDGEVSLTAELRDAAGRPARAHTTILVHAAAAPDARWSDPTPAADLAPPAWLADALFYQIHTRTFGDEHGAGIGTFDDVRARLDHLVAMGVDAIQLMPLFDGPSGHGYVSDSFYRVDRAFGHNRDFRRLVDDAHRRGLRVVLDFSDTATQTTHEVFGRAVIEPAHPWRSMINWTSPGRYSSYNLTHDTHNGSWPQFDFARPETRRMMARMMIHWITAFGVDGFRLDSVERVKPFPSHEWWRILRREVKAAAPHALLYGEVYEKPERFLGDQLDMAYDGAFNEALKRAVRDGDARGFAELVARLRDEDPRGTRGLRFIANHDSDRAMTVFGGERRRSLLAFAALLTMPGVPFLYYGDEFGMDGGGVHGPNTNRRPMTWATGDRAMGEAVARLGRLRRAHATLRNAGGFVPVPVRPRRAILAYLRTAESGPQFLVLMNLTPRTVRARLQAPIPPALRGGRALTDALVDALDPAAAPLPFVPEHFRLELAPLSYRVFELRS